MSKEANFTDDIDHLAHKRASRKMGWYLHAFVFVAVNLALAALAAAGARPHVMFPSLGWALGLFIHGLVVFVFLPGNGLRERMVQRERAYLTAQRDPW
jgi:hypothetical protein